jgi:hypothetical protein
MKDWSDQKTDNAFEADLWDLYKVEKWTKDGARPMTCSAQATISTKPSRSSPRALSTGRGSG